MQKSFFILIPMLFLAFVVPLNRGEFQHYAEAAEQGPLQPLLPPNTAAPSAPDAGIDMEAAARDVANALHPEESLPTQIVIPSLKINSWVDHVGINALGEMEVPDGSSRNVGWYKFGTVPGDVGSAVMDAHVYAAFKKLKNAKIGNSIYVIDAKGETIEFKVISSKAYPLAQVPMNAIFNDQSGIYLNLITCEGKYIRAGNTYSHRRVVYTERVN